VTTADAAQGGRAAGFRTRVFVAIMLVVTAVTLAALALAQRRLEAEVETELERTFEAELAVLRRAHDMRRAALLERCRALVRRQRIRAALEDDALDLLYPNAADELRDVLGGPGDPAGPALRARFYRFLDHRGAVIPPSDPRVVGQLGAEQEARLALGRLPDEPQIGYLAFGPGGIGALTMVMAMPIVASETTEPIGALVLGFRAMEPRAAGERKDIKRGFWHEGRFYAEELSDAAAAAVSAQLAGDGLARAAQDPVRVTLDGVPHLIFAKVLNPGSLYPPTHELCVFPLTELHARQRQLRWQVLGAGVLLLGVAFGASRFASARLSAPVEKLAVDSERSARFSADASHQLKTPVTVLRAGLEELLARDNLTPDECREISALIHQTYRLSSLVDDLLLLSRMDAGRLTLKPGAVDLGALIAASLDDLSALPDELGLDVEAAVPPGLTIAGDKRYTAIILQNLLENARKYNRRGGKIRIAAATEGETVWLRVANDGTPIAPAAQSHIFERFHRGAMGENVPGYGLGLNLARELARLHGGDLRLRRSDETGTEFEVIFRRDPANVPGVVAS
jgi:signal transduction histidine kinase